jgi:hypothetical protein
VKSGTGAHVNSGIRAHVNKGTRALFFKQYVELDILYQWNRSSCKERIQRSCKIVDHQRLCKSGARAHVNSDHRSCERGATDHIKVEPEIM